MIIPALLTPFDSDLAIDAEALRRCVDRLLESGIEDVVACGTMGEAGSLSEDERALVIRTAIDAGARVTVGVSAYDGNAAGRFARQAAELGAVGVMCTPPIAYTADEREIEWHYRTLCEATELPVMLYNNPEASKADMSPELIARLAQHERVASVKECSGDARRIAAIREISDVDVLIGGDDWALEGYAAGAVGWVSGVANVMPRECLDLERLVMAGDLEAARELWPKLLPLARLDMTPKLVQHFKAALDMGPCRPPRLPL